MSVLNFLSDFFLFSTTEQTGKATGLCLWKFVFHPAHLFREKKSCLSS